MRFTSMNRNHSEVGGLVRRLRVPTLCTVTAVERSAAVSANAHSGASVLFADITETGSAKTTIGLVRDK